MSIPPIQVGWCDDGEPLMKDASSKGFEKWLAGLQSPQEFTEMRQLILQHPTLTDERRAFYGRCLAITARLEFGLRLDPSTGVYATPLPPTHA